MNYKKPLLSLLHPQDIENSGFLVSDARHYDLLLRAKSEIEILSLYLIKK